MSLGVRRAAPAALIVACALAVPAAHADDRLVGAIAQVQDAQTGDLPQLTDDPPGPLGTPTATPAPTSTATPTASATPSATASPGSQELARTGSEAGLAALAGLSLLGAGLSLRALTVDGAPD